MNTIKATAIILVTLITGIILGVLAGGWLSERQLKAFIEYRTEEGFRRVALEVLDPGEDQVDKLMPIIDQYALMNRQLNQSYRRDLEALQLSYWSEIQPYLNEAQINRLVGTNGHRGRPGPPENTVKDDDPLSFDPGPGKPGPRTGRNPARLNPDSVDFHPGPDSIRRGPAEGRPPEGPPRHRPGDAPGPVQKAETFSLMMKNQLSLDDEVYQKVRKINLEHAITMKGIHDKYRDQPGTGMMSEISELENKRNAQMKELLSEPQYLQYDQMMERLKKAWLHRRGRH